MSQSTGTVTFLFTDIEGSTQLWERHPQAMPAALARHDALLRQAVETHAGQIVKLTGDGCLAVFAAATAALGAAIAAQHTLSGESWADLLPDMLRVRMALHTGEAEMRNGDYFGAALNRTERLMAIGHGGQVLLSAATAALVSDALLDGAALRDMGEQRLKDLTRPEHVYQLLHPALPAEFAPLRSLEAYPNNLPVQLTSFIGREREMREALQLLNSARLLTLTGSGGTGKTRLALQVAAEALTRFSDGAWLVELAPLDQAGLIPHTILTVFGLGDALQRPALDAVTDYLHGRHVLLVLDNCEHLIDGCARVVDHLLHAAPQLKILATSREALGISGETAYRLPSLSLPQTNSAADTLASEAAQLFVARAQAANPRLVLDEHSQPAVAAVCRRLDGIPLALELAAARARVFSIEQIAARLDDRFRLLTGGSRSALPRQQTLRALIDWSYDLLSNAERSFLRRLSVFVGGLTFEAAEAVCPQQDVLELLPNLVNKSLVVVDENMTRYHLLETIRQYARDRLFEAGEAASARDCHLDYILRFTSVATPGEEDTREADWMEAIDADYDNIRAAIEWAVDQRPEDALRVLGNLYYVWQFRVDRLQTLVYIQEALQRLDDLPPVTGEYRLRRAEARAIGLVLKGQMSISMGQYVAAAGEFADAIAARRELGDRPILNVGLAMLSLASVFISDLAVVESLVADLNRIPGADENSWLHMMTLPAIIKLASARGDSAARARYHAEGCAFIGKYKNPVQVPWYLTMGMDARQGGDLDIALQYLNAGTALSRRLKTRLFDANLASEWAHAARQSGRHDVALNAYRKLIVEWRAAGHRAAVANLLECMGFIARAEGALERAAQLLGSAEALRALIADAMTPYEQTEYAREVAALRAAMPPALFEAAWAEGHALSMDGAVAVALAQTPATP